MHRFVVRSAIKGNMYVGPSLEAALETIQRDVYTMRFEHQSPSDAVLYVDGTRVETGMNADGKRVIRPKREPVPLPPSSMPPKWPKH